MEDTMTVATAAEESTPPIQPTSDTQTSSPEPPAADEQDEQPMDYAALEAQDMEQLRREFPELHAIRSLSQLQQPARYGTLRELGLTPKEAYLATEHRRVQTVDNRAHLRSAMPHAVGGSGEPISAAELAAARELFLGLSDHEIRKLYKKVTA